MNLPVCLHCYEVFDPRMIKLNECNLCPRLKCNHDLVLIDENMIPIIFELNKKGYDTVACCSSHIWEIGRIDPDPSSGTIQTVNNFYHSMYILFDINVALPSVPTGFSIDMEHYEEEYDPKVFDAEFIKQKKAEPNFRCHLAKTFDPKIPNNPTHLEAQKYNFDNLNILLEWACNLPIRDTTSSDKDSKDDKVSYEGLCTTPKVNANMTVFSPEIKMVFDDNDDDYCSKEEMTTARRLKEEILEDAGYYKGVDKSIDHLWFLREGHAKELKLGDGYGWADELKHYPCINSLKPFHLVLESINNMKYEDSIPKS